MVKQESVMAPTRQTIDVICNKCGESTRCPMGNFECISAIASWGYSSRKDMENHLFDLCEDCYDKLAESFVIPVTIEGLLEGELKG